MPPNYIALAIPFFFLFIGVELIVARRRGRRVYRLNDASSDIACGVVSQLATVFLHGVLIAGYVVVHRHALITFSPQSVAPWLIAFFGIDLIYYWWHRLSHEVNVLWAAHVVHHTSEDYNLAVALRQAVTTHFTVIPFYLPLALAGVSPLVFLTIYSFNILYQFWIHTELIGRLGPMEGVLNTPSAHRVHHAINRQYLDRNYGGTLMIWDRLFGSYEPEVEQPVYGTVAPLASFDPLWSQVHYWVALARAAVSAPRRSDKWRLWWKSPEWHPEGMPGYPLPDAAMLAARRKYDPPAGIATRRYVLLHFTLALIAAFLILFYQTRLPMTVLAGGSALVVLTLAAAAALLEGRRWAWSLEAVRLIAVAGSAAAFALLSW